MKVANSEELLDNCYFVRNFLPSRFYKYLVGKERVATEQILDAIFDYNSTLEHSTVIPKLESIDIPLELKRNFQDSLPVEKNYLGNSLLLGLTFMKLCIQKCPKCILSLKQR